MKCLICGKSRQMAGGPYHISGVALHHFPSESNKRLMWLQAILKPTNTVITNGDGICSEHFKDSDYKFLPKLFEYDQLPSRPVLKYNAIPTLNEVITRKPIPGSQQPPKFKKGSKECSEKPADCKQVSGDEDEMQIVPERLVKIQIIDTRIIMQESTGSINGLVERSCVLTRDLKESIADLDEKLQCENSCTAEDMVLSVILDHAYSRIKERKKKTTKNQKGKSRKSSCLLRRKRKCLSRSSDDSSSGSDFETFFYSKRRRRKTLIKKYVKASDSETIVYSGSDLSPRHSDASEPDLEMFHQAQKENPSASKTCRFEIIRNLKSEVDMNPHSIASRECVEENEMPSRIKSEIMSDSETACSEHTLIGLPLHSECTKSESPRTSHIETEILPFCALPPVVESDTSTEPDPQTFLMCNIKSEIMSSDE